LSTSQHFKDRGRQGGFVLLTLAPLLLLLAACSGDDDEPAQYAEPRAYAGLLVGMYLVTGFGITIGYHRYFTHRSFQTPRVAPPSTSIVAPWM
jgi:stearoyl-CoA desaturase (Delta-9 desaturase)